MKLFYLNLKVFFKFCQIFYFSSKTRIFFKNTFFKNHLLNYFLRSIISNFFKVLKIFLNFFSKPFIYLYVLHLKSTFK